MRKELSELKEAFAAKITKLKSKAEHYGDDSSKSEMSEMMQDMSWMMESVSRRMGWLEEDMYGFMANHMKNHPPHPETVTQMQSALKAFGMDRDYDVQKKILTVANRRKENLASFLERELSKNG